MDPGNRRPSLRKLQLTKYLGVGEEVVFKYKKADLHPFEWKMTVGQTQGHPYLSVMPSVDIHRSRKVEFGAALALIDLSPILS